MYVIVLKDDGSYYITKDYTKEIEDIIKTFEEVKKIITE